MQGPSIMEILQAFAETPSFWQTIGFIIASAMFIGALLDGNLRDYIRWIVIIVVFIILQESARYTFLESNAVHMEGVSETSLFPIVLTVGIAVVYIGGMILGYLTLAFGAKYHHYMKRRNIANGSYRANQSDPC